MKMIKSMDMEHLFGMMAVNILVNGERVNNMVEECLLNPQENKEKENGKMVGDKDGQMKETTQDQNDI